MSNAAIWPGSSSFTTGSTPFGFYDTDTSFQTDADRVANFCARRLGYPIVNIELQDINFYAAFEEAVTTYGNEVYSYKIRQDYLNIEGLSTGSNINNSIITPNLGNIIKMSQQYGQEVGVGGTVTWYTGSLQLTANTQNYDLKVWASQSASLQAGDTIEVKRVFYEAPPAIVRYFDPYAGTGTGMMQLLDTFGWGNYSPAINFLMMPMNFDLQKLQAIELNDQIRRSNYSFEIVNNNLRIFPIPVTTGGILRFEYIKVSERNNSLITGSQALVSNVSNVPYTNPVYSQINSVGRQWIFEYTLALVKEILGFVRGKYSTIPIPNSEATLNGAELISSGQKSKEDLLNKLKMYLEETSREKLLERRSMEVEYRQKELQQVPFLIYIG